MPRSFVSVPFFLRFFAIGHRVFPLHGNIGIRDFSQMSYWDDVDLHRTPTSCRPKRYLGFSGPLINIKASVFATVGCKFVARAELNAAKHAVHKHHGLRSPNTVRATWSA